MESADPAQILALLARNEEHETLARLPLWQHGEIVLAIDDFNRQDDLPLIQRHAPDDPEMRLALHQAGLARCARQVRKAMGRRGP